MSKLSQAIKKMVRAEPKKARFDYSKSDSPERTALKQKLADLADKVKKEKR